VRRWRRAKVATPGEWQCKTARSGECAQHFSNASCFNCLGHFKNIFDDDDDDDDEQGNVPRPIFPIPGFKD